MGPNDRQRKEIDRLVADGLVRGDTQFGFVDATGAGVLVVGSQGGRYLVHPDGTSEVAHGRDRGPGTATSPSR